MDVTNLDLKSKYKLIKQGAEAKIFCGLDEQLKKDVIIKQRFKKTYRHEDLDKSLTKKRIKNEAKLLKKAFTLGLDVPQVFKLDLENGLLFMEYISDSIIAKEYLISLAKTDSDPKELEEKLNNIAREIGKYIAILHRNEIIHGDLTSSNILVRKSTNESIKLVFIDFGLSFVSHQLEDKAVDLYVLERALLSTHSQHAQKIIDQILASYCIEYGRQHEKVIERFEQVRLRGRKRTMIG